MIVTSLKLANVRAIESCEFSFRRGFNLIAGTNGVGKSSVLDSLRVCLSAFVRKANDLRWRVEAFEVDDIRAGADALTVECDAQFGRMFRYVFHKPREDSVPQEGKAGRPREQVHRTPMRSGFIGPVPMALPGARPGGRPLAVLFATKRAVPSERAPRKSVSKTKGGVEVAFADAFANRELRLGELAMWMRVQEEFRLERALAQRALGAFEAAIVRFLPGYSSLRPDGDPPRLLINRGDRTIRVRQMSDGERGVLALVLDLTRRLVLANPELKDPVSEAKAVVLIDELDLHLHPQWQRQIAQKLMTTFPRCQFIATSHSPQVVASVDPEQVHLLTTAGVIQPDRSRGMDSNWILRHLMEAHDRPMDAKVILESVERSVEQGAFSKARAEMSEAKRKGFDLPEWSILEARIARLEILAQ